MKYMKLLLAVALAVLLCGPAGPAAAQGGSQAKAKDYQVYDLGEVVVAGENPGVRQISVISEVTAEDIEATHSLTVPEALSYVPGVVVTTGRKNEPEISVHGLNQEEVAILIDGVPYYETNYGKLNLNQLPTEMIARIDVIKGAPSVLYGPNAMGGVINIITKKQVDHPTFSGMAEIGDYGNYRVSASHGNSIGKFNYWVNFNRRDIVAWRMSDDYEPTEGTLVKRPGKTTDTVLEDGGRRNNSDLTQTSLWAKVGLQLGKESQYYASAYIIDAEWGFPTATDSERVFTSRPAFSNLGRMDLYQDWGVDLSGEQRLTDMVKLRGKLFYHNHVDEYASFSDTEYENKIAVSRWEDYIVGGAIFSDVDLHATDTLRLAFHYRGDSHSERDDDYLPFAETFSYTGSLAAENEWRPIKGLSVVAGISYDWYNVDKAESNVTDRDTGDFVRTEELETPGVKDGINPMVGLSYSFEDSTRLFASVARKTRFPTLQQMYSGSSGNPDLDAQSSINYSLGVSRPFGGIAFVEAAVFYHDITDRISRDGPDPDSMYHNYASVKLYGFEVGGELTPIQGLKLRLDYTFLQAQDDSDSAVTDEVVGAPEHKIDARITYTVPKLGTRLNLQGLFVGEQYSQLPTPANPDDDTLMTGSYFLANVKVSQPLWDNFEAYAWLGNVFDRDYESESGFPGPGRNFWIGLNAKF